MNLNSHMISHVESLCAVEGKRDENGDRFSNLFEVIVYDYEVDGQRVPYLLAVG